MAQFLYPCDPANNTGCKKTACHLNGGKCRHTANLDFAIQPVEKVLFVVPKEDTDESEEET